MTNAKRAMPKTEPTTAKKHIAKQQRIDNTVRTWCGQIIALGEGVPPSEATCRDCRGYCPQAITPPPRFDHPDIIEM